MGNYTSFKTTLRLKRDIPLPVFSLLNTVVNLKGEPFPDPTFEELSQYTSLNNPFFQCPRWTSLLCSVMDDSGKKAVSFKRNKSCFVLSLDTEFKNYDDEIIKFIHWIAPYVRSRKKKIFLGESQFQELGSMKTYYYKTKADNGSYYIIEKIA